MANSTNRLQGSMSSVTYSRKEEFWNASSHLLGAFFAFFGLFILLNENTNKTEFAKVSILIYSITLISMLLVSGLYHSVKNERLKRKLRVLDHINIYFLIAGTYTPVSLITLLRGSGWTIFYTVWIIALLGTLFKIFNTGRFEFVSLLLYVVMGWLIVIDFDNLTDYVTSSGLKLLFSGGLFYTLGIIFYAWERVPFNHFIWHLFVLGGAICHWFLIYSIVS
ncbi:PAQR family membrane homeostasis protein TrhA [Maribacter sp. 2210JD10-5]|uniref:PAQR family membrane homeostasis protein TrhA n=1 Tax=Maribacter sp. 2210JD10-5 TaxID=3386272 RepID=UPI0039BCC189